MISVISLKEIYILFFTELMSYIAFAKRMLSKMHSTVYPLKNANEIWPSNHFDREKM